MTTVFETEVCSRCGGSGNYSFNGEHSRCYKCDGKNGARAYTKRGAAAKAYYLAKFRVAASEIKPGDLIEIPGGGKIRVLSVEMVSRNWKINHIEMSGNRVVISGQSQSYETNSCELVRRFPSVEENENALADALAYQATLTKAGTPRK